MTKSQHLTIPLRDRDTVRHGVESYLEDAKTENLEKALADAGFGQTLRVDYTYGKDRLFRLVVTFTNRDTLAIPLKMKGREYTTPIS